jgi:hypothetical protein
MSEHPINVEIGGTKLYAEAPTPACGDPYVAVVMETDEQNIPINKEAITLGSGFKSIDDIAQHLKRILAYPEQYEHDIEFTPDRAQVFGVTGSVDFTPVTQDEFEVELNGESFTVKAETELDARYQAASTYKKELSGPEVGVGVSELAEQATITSADVNSETT